MRDSWFNGQTAIEITLAGTLREQRTIVKFTASTITMLMYVFYFHCLKFGFINIFIG